MHRGSTPSAPMVSGRANWQAGNRDIGCPEGGASRPSFFFGHRVRICQMPLRHDSMGFRSYDPIHCQGPQWPRRPLAIGRRGLSLTRPGPPPACRRRLRLSLISADTVLSARTPFLRRGSPSLSGRIRRAPRAQRNRGCPRRPPGSPERGLCLFRALPAHHAEGPEPPHELRRGGRVGLRLGHAAGEHLLAPPQEPLGPLPPVHPYLEGHARVP